MKDTLKGRFRPKNPIKYIGNSENIIYRSSWELEFFKWIDGAPTVIGWNSEELVIPYINVLDKTPHRYYPDIFARIIKNRRIVPTLIEIKPEQFSTLPVRKKRQSQKVFMESLERYYKNGSKWLAAKKYCDEHGWEFLLICKDVTTNSFVEKNNLMLEAIYRAKQVISG